MKRNETHWLQYGDSCVCFLSFVGDGKGGVMVKGPLGAASYIAKSMPIAEARQYWKDRVAEGYHRIDNTKAPSYHAHEAATYGL